MQQQAPTKVVRQAEAAWKVQQDFWQKLQSRTAAQRAAAPAHGHLAAHAAAAKSSSWEEKPPLHRERGWLAQWLAERLGR